MRALTLLLLLPALARAGGRINHEGRILGPAPVVTARHPLQHAGGGRDRLGHADHAARQPVERGHLQPPRAGEQRRDDRADHGRSRRRIAADPAPVLRDELRARARTTSHAVPIQFFELSGRVRSRRRHFAERPLSHSAEHAGRNLAAETGTLTLAQWQQDIDDDGGDRHSIIVKPGAGFIWETWLTRLVGSDLAGVERREVQSQLERPAPRRLDLRRRRRAADVSGAGALRRMPARHGRARPAARREADPRRGYDLSRHAPGFGRHPPPIPNMPAMGQRLRLKAELRHSRELDDAGKGRAARAEEIRRHRGGQRRLLLRLGHAGRSLPEERLTTSSTASPSPTSRSCKPPAPTGGPRSPGAPTAECRRRSIDAHRQHGEPRRQHHRTPSPSRCNWKRYSGPGTVDLWQCHARPVTTAAFPVPGRLHAHAQRRRRRPRGRLRCRGHPCRPHAGVTRNGNDMVVYFPGAAGHHYRVERSSDLVSWTIHADNLPGTGGTLNITHTGAFGILRSSIGWWCWIR